MSDEDLKRGRDVAKQPKTLFSLPGLVSYEGIPGFEGLGFNLLLATSCDTVSRVGLAVSNF